MALYCELLLSRLETFLIFYFHQDTQHRLSQIVSDFHVTCGLEEASLTSFILKTGGFLNKTFFELSNNKLNVVTNRPTFASQITSSVALAEARSSSAFKDTKYSISVNIRRYRGLKSCGYGVTNKSVTYEPFKLSLTFREAPPEEHYKKDSSPCSSLPTVNASMLLVISATPLRSVYESKTKLGIFILNVA